MTYNRLVRSVVRLVTNMRMRKLGTFRSEVGLPPTREDFFLDFGRANTAEAIFGLFSPRFCPVQPDHPKNLVVPGFPFYRSRDPERSILEIGLDAFVAAGEPPIVFTLGSFAVEASDGFFDQSLRAARALGKRAVLLTGEKDAERLRPVITEEEYVCARAPHSLLFRSALCVVHHGGIGTTAEALRAGKPQIVVPFFGDQPDHAMRVMRLGIGLSVSPAKYDEQHSTDALRKLLTGDYRKEADRLAALIATERGVEEVADWASSILQNSEAATQEALKRDQSF
jgi:UDP:flavonoid glycosyltransferase YjiC (YdhE family)